MTRLTLAACVLLLSLLHVCAVPLSPWTKGTASFFGGPQDSNSNAFKLTIDSGSCGYGEFDPRLYPFYNVVGLHKSNPLVANRPMDACGSCLEIQCIGEGPHCNGRRRIQTVITDQCVENCDSTNVNIHVFGFEKLAPISVGRTQVRYRLVECQPADPVTVHIKNYRATEGGWIRFALKNIAGSAALTTVEIAAGSAPGEPPMPVDSQTWMPCTNTYGAVWEAGMGGVALPEAPLDLRVTNSLLQQLVIRNFVARNGTMGDSPSDVETTAQFPSPFESDNSSNYDDSSLEEEPFVAPVPQGNPTVTEGVGIIKPTNTLYGPPMENTHGSIKATEDNIDHSNLEAPADSTPIAPANNLLNGPASSNLNGPASSNLGAPVNNKPGAPASVNAKVQGPATPQNKTKSQTSQIGPKPQLAAQAPVSPGTRGARRTAAPTVISTAPVQAQPPAQQPSAKTSAGSRERGPSAGAQVYGILENINAPAKPAGRSPGGRRLLNGF